MKKAMFAFVFLLLSISVTADMIIANSASWQNVYSAGMYAALEGHEFRFLNSQPHSETIQQEIPKHKKITVIESDTIPYVKNYANILQKSGYDANTILIPENQGSFDLAKRLNAQNYIIVDPTYGYDAISVTPYATHSRSFVLFADNENINEVSQWLQLMDVQSMIIYGTVDDSVVQVLTPYNPQIINEGNRFKNNIAISERLRQETNTEQAILTNGEFLEQDFFNSDVKQPLIFIGRDNPPEESLAYLARTHYKSLVVIGNDLISSANAIKESVGIPLFIKFAKGTTGDGGFKEVQALDMYPVPQLALELTIDNLRYNTALKQVELIVENKEAAKTYLQNNLVIKVDDQPVLTVGDEELQLIDDLEVKGYTYDADLTEHLDGKIKVDVFTIYGANEEELERAIKDTLSLEIVSEGDLCELELIDIAYDADTQRIEVTVKSDEPCYTRIRMPSIIIDDEETTIESEVEQIDGTSTIIIKQRMDEVDLADNVNVLVEARHGTRAELLSQVTRDEFELNLKQHLSTQNILTGIIAIMGILILLLWKRKK